MSETRTFASHFKILFLQLCGSSISSRSFSTSLFMIEAVLRTSGIEMEEP